MRDLERWKDKVELSLDGRQIFFLFFGSAVAVCLIFVGGILVGKRIEQRAMAVTPHVAEDPLAMLDQLGAGEDEGLTFHQTLAPSSERHGRTDVVEAKVTRPEAQKPEAAKVTKPEAPKPEVAKVAKPEGIAKVTKPEGIAKVTKPEPAVEGSRPTKVELPRAGKPEFAKAVKPEAGKPDLAKAVKPEAGKPELAKAPKPEAARGAPSLEGQGAKVVVAAAKPGVKGPQRFTLQLSAFAERGDAEQFLQKMQSAGYRPFLVHSDVPGRGLFYRVRVGDYGSRQAALQAKSEIERRQRVVAYVARL